MSEILIPLLVGLFCVYITALLTINIKFSQTKDEAQSLLKKVVINLSVYGGIVFAVYNLANEVLSDEALSRIVIFRIGFYLASIVYILLLHEIIKILHHIIFQGQLFDEIAHILNLQINELNKLKGSEKVKGVGVN